MDKDMKKIAEILLGLFLIALMAGVTYIGADYLKETACEIGDTGYNWTGTSCVNSTGSAQSVDALTGIDLVVGLISVVLGLLALVLIMKIFKIVITAAKGFSGGE